MRITLIGNALIAVQLAVSSVSIAAPSRGDIGIQLYAETSRADESMDQFVKRIAPRALAYTQKHNVEACGNIEATSAGFRIEIYSGLPMSCVTPLSDAPTFHTHPDYAIPAFSDADYSRPGYLAHKRTLKYQAGKGTIRIVSSWLDLRQTP